MTARTRAQLKSDADSTVPDNASGSITPAIMRQRLKDVADSAVLPQDVGTVVQAHSSVLDGTTASFTTADEAKLDAIEAAADVTDAGNVGAAIHGASGKTTPVDADTFGLIDSAASNVLKKVTWANIKATLWTALGALIAGGTGKTTPVDGDTLALSDSAASNASKKLTWANVKATLKTYFDTLYQGAHANLSAFAGLSLIADRLPYANGSGTLSLATFTSFARSLLDDADAAAARQTLQLGEFEVNVYKASNVAVGSYYADRSAPFASTQDTLYAEIVAGDPGGAFDFYIEVAGSNVYGPVTVTQGTPRTATGLAKAVAKGAAVNFVVTYVSGNVTDITIRTSGAT